MSSLVDRDRPARSKRRPVGRTYVFVSAAEPLAAAQAVWSTARPVDLCVSAPSPEGRATAAFAIAGRAVRIDEEPLLVGPQPGEGEVELAGRMADALRALYALDTRCALVVWDALTKRATMMMPNVSATAVVDEDWLLETAELIERRLPFP